MGLGGDKEELKSLCHQGGSSAAAFLTVPSVPVDGAVRERPLPLRAPRGTSHMPKGKSPPRRAEHGQSFSLALRETLKLCNIR